MRLRKEQTCESFLYNLVLETLQKAKKRIEFFLKQRNILSVDKFKNLNNFFSLGFLYVFSFVILFVVKTYVFLISALTGTITNNILVYYHCSISFYFFTLYLISISTIFSCIYLVWGKYFWKLCCVEICFTMLSGLLDFLWLVPASSSYWLNSIPFITINNNGTCTDNSELYGVCSLLLLLLAGILFYKKLKHLFLQNNKTVTLPFGFIWETKSNNKSFCFVFLLKDVRMLCFISILIYALSSADLLIYISGKTFPVLNTMEGLVFKNHYIFIEWFFYPFYGIILSFKKTELSYFLVAYISLLLMLLPFFNFTKIKVIEYNEINKFFSLIFLGSFACLFYLSSLKEADHLLVFCQLAVVYIIIYILVILPLLSFSENKFVKTQLLTKVKPVFFYSDDFKK